MLEPTKEKFLHTFRIAAIYRTTKIMYKTRIV